MKVIDLGRGLKGIVPEADKPADSIRSFTVARLKRGGFDEETIQAYKNYIKRTARSEYEEDVDDDE
ncbi:MAG: hypothetical protein FWD68_19745 [Alphaproteobacteria bacterium]|nr:hypothetical protein [Alphaproteobacteria bacterium]